MAAVTHESRSHAMLSASGGERWLNCTPSARLEDKIPEPGISTYAEEGTLAHEFADLYLKLHGTKEITKKVYDKEYKKLTKHKLYSPEMDREVEKYTSYVLEEFAEFKRLDPESILLIEERIDFSHIVEQGFGTGDATIIGNKTIKTIDLKYGKGIAVSAVKNTQLRLYAIGNLHKHELDFDIDKSEITIVQPRLDIISTYLETTNELLNWAVETVKPAAAKAFKGDGVKKAGDWCKFCKVKGICATLAEENLKLAKHEFKDPHFLSDEGITDIYKVIPLLLMWAKGVEEHMLREALNGKKWPGLKVVEGTARRKWKNDDEVIERLDSLFSKDELSTTKVLGITDMQKLVGKEIFQTLSDLIETPKGAPALVHENDKRQEINSTEQAISDFKTV